MYQQMCGNKVNEQKINSLFYWNPQRPYKAKIKKQATSENNANTEQQAKRPPDHKIPASINLNKNENIQLNFLCT